MFVGEGVAGGQPDHLGTVGNGFQIDFSKLGSQPHRRGEIGNRSVVLPTLQERLSPVVVGHRIVRAETDDLVKVSNSTLPLPLGRVAKPAERVGIPMCGVDPYRVRAVFDGLVVSALLAVSRSPVDVGVGVAGPEPDYFGKIGNRPAGITLTARGPAPVEVGVGVFRVESDRLGTVGD